MDVETTGAAWTGSARPRASLRASFMPRSPRPVVPGWPPTPSSITSTLTWPRVGGDQDAGASARPRVFENVGQRLPNDAVCGEFGRSPVRVVGASQQKVTGTPAARTRSTRSSTSASVRAGHAGWSTLRPGADRGVGASRPARSARSLRWSPGPESVPPGRWSRESSPSAWTIMTEMPCATMSCISRAIRWRSSKAPDPALATRSWAWACCEASAERSAVRGGPHLVGHRPGRDDESEAGYGRGRCRHRRDIGEGSGRLERIC